MILSFSHPPFIKTFLSSSNNVVSPIVVHTFTPLEIPVSSSELRQLSSASEGFCCLLTHVLLGWQYFLQTEPICLHGHRLVAHLVLHPQWGTCAVFRCLVWRRRRLIWAKGLLIQWSLTAETLPKIFGARRVLFDTGFGFRGASWPGPSRLRRGPKP